MHHVRTAMTPNRIVTTTKVVTKREARKPFRASARQCKVNRRPRDPLQRSRCSPRADKSIGDVSGESPNDDVLQIGGVITALEFMKDSSRGLKPSAVAMGLGRYSNTTQPGSTSKGLDSPTGATLGLRQDRARCGGQRRDTTMSSAAFRMLSVVSITAGYLPQVRFEREGREVSMFESFRLRQWSTCASARPPSQRV